MTIEIMFHRAVGPLQCNCYVVGDPSTKEAIVIDPGGDATEITSAIDERGLNVTAIVATHAHFDHLVAAAVVRDHTKAPMYLHASDLPLLDWFQESGRMFLGIELGPPPEIDTSPAEGDVLRVGGAELSVIHTPGHSPGSISLLGETMLFSGDTLFADSIGRSDLPGGDTNLLVASIRDKLFTFGDDLPVHPGHGPATTIARERRFNPFVGANGGLIPPR